MSNMLKLHKYHDSEPIWFNPDNIIGFEAYKEGTRLYVPGEFSEYDVAEHPEQVQGLIQSLMTIVKPIGKKFSDEMRKKCADAIEAEERIHGANMVAALAYCNIGELGSQYTEIRTLKARIAAAIDMAETALTLDSYQGQSPDIKEVVRVISAILNGVNPPDLSIAEAAAGLKVAVKGLINSSSRVKTLLEDKNQEPKAEAHWCYKLANAIRNANIAIHDYNKAIGSKD